MRPVAATVVAFALGMAAFGMGGCARQEPPPAKNIETSYPSPEFLPQTDEPPAQKPVRPSGLAERPLTGPAQAPAVARPQPSPEPHPAAPPNAAAQFDAMDADHNGRVTLEEWRNFQEREFRRLDKNDDGVITREEMSSAPAARSGGRKTPPAP
jgi:hypothetical protein